MHSWTSRASRSSAHSAGFLLQKPSSSVLPPKVRSVRFTQQPSRWTIFTEVHATSAQHVAKSVAISRMSPSCPRVNMATRPRGGTQCPGANSSARRAQLVDQVRKPQRTPGMIAQRGDGLLQPPQRIRTERPLDLFQVALLRQLLARLAAEGGVPEIVEVGQPLGAGDGGPLARVEPD